MEISLVLKQYGIDHLHYMACPQNAANIIRSGIYCHSKAKDIPNHTDTSLPEVQNKRKRRVPNTSKTIQDYVPLYFATHTPTQYVWTQGPNPYFESPEILIFFEIDALKVFSDERIHFTDGNAASDETEFFFNISDLSNLDWDIILYSRNCWGTEYKRKKAAEVLFPGHVPPGWFVRIVVYNENAKVAVEDFIKKQKTKRGNLDLNLDHLDSLRVEIDKTHYF